MDRPEERSWFFIGNIEKAEGVVVTDTGKHRVVFRGSFGFRVNHHGEGGIGVQLVRLNLLAEGVKAEAGDTGTIGLRLEKPEYEARFDPGDGSLKARFNLVLHYPLIDEKMGFRETEKLESVVFVPYTEVMEGSLTTSLPREFVEGVPAKFEAKAQIQATIASSVVEAVQALQIGLIVPVFVLFRFTDVLAIQPVFIGSGPCDPSATGKDFDVLMSHAHDMWNRCGTVRCITFTVRPPVYLNEDQYRVIHNSGEGWALGQEHTDPDAVEVFVVEQAPRSWGGGATWGSGTASAFIVTSDEQLDVPCPPPCGYGDCGDVNYYHLAHELGHVLNLDHPDGAYGLAPSSADSVMEPSGFCLDNPNAQSAKNCRNASNPLMVWGLAVCSGSPDIMD